MLFRVSFMLPFRDPYGEWDYQEVSEVVAGVDMEQVKQRYINACGGRHLTVVPANEYDIAQYERENCLDN